MSDAHQIYIEMADNVECDATHVAAECVRDSSVYVCATHTSETHICGIRDAIYTICVYVYVWIDR